MDYRKLCLKITIVLSALLFIAGTSILIYINTTGFDSVKASAETGANTDAGQGGDIFGPFRPSTKPFNVLILGGDIAPENERARSDTMILANFDPVSYKITLMSIPRDTRVIIDKKEQKINYAYPHAGMDLAASTVSELLGVKIKYYVYIDTSAFRKIVDLLGGVDVNIPLDLDYDDPKQDLHIHLKKGLQHLDGAHAEQYVRFRHPRLRSGFSKEMLQYYDGSDLDRIKAQQAFLREMISQKLNIQYFPRINSLLQVIYKNIKTNFTMNEVLNLSFNLSKLDESSFNFIPLPGKPQDSTPWYYLCDIEKARETAAQYFQCDTSFVYLDPSWEDVYTRNPGTGEDTGSKRETSGSRDVTEGNPSNTDSSLDGEQAPAP